MREGRGGRRAGRSALTLITGGGGPVTVLPAADGPVGGVEPAELDASIGRALEALGQFDADRHAMVPAATVLVTKLATQLACWDAETTVPALLEHAAQLADVVDRLERARGTAIRGVDTLVRLRAYLATAARVAEQDDLSQRGDAELRALCRAAGAGGSLEGLAPAEESS